MVSLGEIISSFWKHYTSTTSSKIQLIDYYMAACFFCGVAQFVYVVLVGTFPFNSFLSGFISCVASFVLAACLRIQLVNDFKGISKERAIADWIFCNLVLHLAVLNFIG